MILRPRQEELVAASLKALDANRNTLAVAPTGAGKTVMLSAIAGSYDSCCVMQHRIELVNQNRATFRDVNPEVKTDLFTSKRKNFIMGGATFAMMQTLVGHLDKIKPVDLLVIDEVHRIGAPSYIKILKAFRDINPGVHILGVTATPERGDGKSLSHAFDNVSDVITLGELINAGHLVKPRTFVIDLNIKEALAGVKIIGRDYDMGQVDEILNTDVLNHRVFEEWKAIASDRRTVAFCATVDHAKQLAKEFEIQGVKTGVVYGAMPECERKRVLADLDQGKIQFLANCAVLTEGWDCQPVDCILLGRPSSYRSTVIQMAGRGLRKVDPERYPGIIKDDCFILDFGCSLLTHPDIFESSHAEVASGAIQCPECFTKLPKGIHYCPICGYEFPRKKSPEQTEGDAPPKDRNDLDSFRMTEISLIELSPFKWSPAWEGHAMVCNGLTAEAFAILREGVWYAIGKVPQKGAVLIYKSYDKIQAMSAADDFMRKHGSRSGAKKTKEWINFPASDKQCEILGVRSKFSVNRYQASCLISLQFNTDAIRTLTR